MPEEITNERLRVWADSPSTFSIAGQGEVPTWAEQVMARELLRRRSAPPVAWRVVCMGEVHWRNTWSHGIENSEARAETLRKNRDEQCPSCGPHRLQPLYAAPENDA